MHFFVLLCIASQSQTNTANGIKRVLCILLKKNNKKKIHFWRPISKTAIFVERQIKERKKNVFYAFKLFTCIDFGLTNQFLATVCDFVMVFVG
jgi:hypothetical protein